MGARVRVAGEGGRRASCPAHAGASRSNLNNTSRPPRHQVTCHAAGKQRTLAPAHTPRRPSLSSRLHTNLGSTSRVMSRGTCDLPLTTRCAAPPAPFEGPTAWKQRRVPLQAHSMSARTSQARVTRLTPHYTSGGSPDTTTLNVIELHPKSPLLLINLKRSMSTHARLRASAVHSHAGAAPECRP